MKIQYYIIILLVISIFNCKNGFTEYQMYGQIRAEKYLRGQFIPSKNKSFILLNTVKIPTNNRKHYLRKEAASALLKLYKDFHKDHPKIPFKVISSTRNFYDQKAIWESKWNGKKLVDGQKLNKTIKDHLKRALVILKYSSMPGTSRHHWGTDFDLNSLNNSYFSKGEGKILYNWMKKNAHKYGFCQPYTSGRNRGYYEEKWHWSYLPLSKRFLYDWNKYYNDDEKFMKSLNFDGIKKSGELSPIYVNSINRNCM